MCILLAELTELQSSADAGDRAAMRVLNKAGSREARSPRSLFTNPRLAKQPRVRVPAWSV